MTDPVEKITAERDQAIAERDRYRGHLHRRVIRDASASAIAAHGGQPKGLDFLVSNQLAVREVGEKFHVVVVDPATHEERVGVSLNDLLTEMRSGEFAHAFDGNADGANTPKPLANNPWAPDTLNVTEQYRLLRKNPGLAKRMQREAGVADGS
jgi:hypothetical protein